MKKLIKLIVIIGVLLVVLLGGAVFLAMQNADKLIAKVKPEAEKLISSAVGADFKIGSVGLTFLPSLKAKVSDITLKRAGESQGFSLNNVLLELDLFKIISGEIYIKNLSVDQPSITIIKDANGVYLQGLPKAKKAESSAVSPAPTTAAPASIPKAPDFLKASLEAFTLSNANILFKDEVAHKEYSVNKVNIKSGLNFAQNELNLVKIDFSGLLLNQTAIGSKIEKVTVDLNSLELKIPEGSLIFSGDSLPINAGFIVPKQSGNFHIETKGLNIANFMPLAKTLVPAMSALSLGGSLNFSADAALDKTAFSVKKNVSLNSLAVQSGPIGLTGEIESLTADIKGDLGSLLPSLNGNGVLKMKDAAIKGFNLAAKVLQAVNVKGNFLAALGQSQGLVSGDDTAISSLSLNYSIANSIVNLAEINMQGPVFNLKGQGTLGLNMNLKLNCQITFSPEISLAIAAQVKEVEAVLDEQKRLTIPLMIEGTIPKVLVLPDVNELLKGAAGNVIKNQIEKEAGKFLNKFKF